MVKHVDYVWYVVHDPMDTRRWMCTQIWYTGHTENCNTSVGADILVPAAWIHRNHVDQLALVPIDGACRPPAAMYYAQATIARLI